MTRSLPGLRQFSKFFPSATRAVTAEQGSSLIEFALVLPVLALLLVGAVDFGRAWYVNLEVASAAEAGALYGVQFPSDISGMKAAASLDAPDLSTLQISATYGNECSDGTSVVALAAYSPVCGTNAIQYVEVDTSSTYKPILTFPGIASTYSLTAKSRMRTSE